ncbi:hypothetical protein GCM10009663_76830 [Kitasatospora arboriphila]|uniref:DUF3107 domain-containing protein n=1 Tax=Kitasatospora arboriphila TaxID=258052 RepID=A0ABN1UAR0_9ACTN
MKPYGAAISDACSNNARGWLQPGGTEAVEVKIGVQNAPREIVLESPQTADEVEGAIAKALEGTSKLLVLADEHGRRVIVPAERLAYVEIGEPSIRKVGFGTL